MYYFISRYDPCVYSEKWYGEYSQATDDVTVLLYNDTDNFCIGYMDEIIEDTVDYITETQALDLIEFYKNTIDENIWFGDKLLYRWKENPNKIEEIYEGV